MTEEEQQLFLQASCQGLPLEQALAVCCSVGVYPTVIFTGERQDDPSFTPRVIQVCGDTLVAAYFRDGTPKMPPEEENA